jgi:hypothetical protein
MSISLSLTSLRRASASLFLCKVVINETVESGIGGRGGQIQD